MASNDQPQEKLIMPIGITAFEPFGGRNVNASKQLVSHLPNRIAGRRVLKYLLPVSAEDAFEKIEPFKRMHPPLLFMFGESSGRSCVSIETRAKNMKIEDGKAVKIEGEGRDVLTTAIPVERIVSEMGDYTVEVSYDAGTYVCNALYYYMLASRRNFGFTCFIHVPYLSFDGDAGADPEEAIAAVVRFIELVCEINDDKEKFKTSMIFVRANVIWESADGTWNRGFFKVTWFGDDFEWDVRYDYNSFEWVSTGHPDDRTAQNAWPWLNPGGYNLVFYKDDPKLCDEYDQMARKYITENNE